MKRPIVFLSFSPDGKVIIDARISHPTGKPAFGEPHVTYLPAKEDHLTTYNEKEKALSENLQLTITVQKLRAHIETITGECNI